MRIQLLAAAGGDGSAANLPHLERQEHTAEHGVDTDAAEASRWLCI